MSNLNIKFVNDLDFKFIHDLIMEHNIYEVCFQEDYDDIDLDHMFTIAHLIQLLSPDIHLTYDTFRTEYPLDNLSVELSLREIPFDCVVLNGKEYIL